MYATYWIGVSGDGTTDHNLLLGPQEYYAHVFEIESGFSVGKKAVYLDGVLRSQGLTAEAERGTCIYAMDLTKLLAEEAVKLFAKEFPDKVSSDRHLGEGAFARLVNIGYKWFKQFKADGAAVAQKWARLMVECKQAEVRKHLGDKLDKLKPEEQHMLLWAFVHNCTMHNINLGAQHGEKAARALTKELTAPMVAGMKEQGYRSDRFSHCPELAQMSHTEIMFFSKSQGYAFGKSSMLPVLMKVRFPDHPVIPFGRACGSRFLHAFSVLRPMLFMRQPKLALLGTQLFKTNMQKIVSSLWSQNHCWPLMMQARAQEGVFTAVLEPMQVMLGAILEKTWLEKEREGEDADETGKLVMAAGREQQGGSIS
jgi:hypothetical protein